MKRTIAEFPEVLQVARRAAACAFGEPDEVLPPDKGNPGRICFCTRDGGNVADETPGENDIRQARKIAIGLEHSFPNVRCSVSTCDEWTDLEVRVHSRRVATRPPTRRQMREALYAQKDRIKQIVMGFGWYGIQDYIVEAPPAVLCIKRGKEWDSPLVWMSIEILGGGDDIAMWRAVVRLGNIAAEMPNMDFSQTAMSGAIDRAFAASQGLDYAWVRFYLAASDGRPDSPAHLRSCALPSSIPDLIKARAEGQILWCLLPSGDRKPLDSRLFARMEEAGVFDPLTREERADMDVIISAADGISEQTHKSQNKL